MTSIQRRDSSSDAGARARAPSRAARAAAPRSRRRCVPRRQSVASPRASARAAIAPPSPARMRVGEAIPELAPLEEQVRRRRGDRGEHPRLLVGRVEDGDELAREEREPLGGQRRERRHRALPEHRRLAEDPVEQRALELLERAGQAPERARRVHPHERLGMEQERLQHLERAPDELGIGRRAASRARSPRGSARRARDRAARRAPARGSSPRTSRGEPQSQRAEIGHLERARAGLPDQDLEPRARLGVLRQRELGAVAEERRARERVEQRPLDDAIARDRRRRARGSAGCARGQREERRDAARRAATCSRRTTRRGPRPRARRRARRARRRPRRRASARGARRPADPRRRGTSAGSARREGSCGPDGAPVGEQRVLELGASPRGSAASVESAPWTSSGSMASAGERNATGPTTGERNRRRCAKARSISERDPRSRRPHPPAPSPWPGPWISTASLAEGAGPGRGGGEQRRGQLCAFRAPLSLARHPRQLAAETPRVEPGRGGWG